MEQFVIAIGIFILGILLGYMFGDNFGDGKEKRDEQLKGRLANHMEPRHYGYNGGFNDITKCTDCGFTGLYEDLHPASCCPKCGGEVEENGSAKWTEIDGIKRWVQSENTK